MANTRLNEVLFLNQQVAWQEKIEGYLWRLEALITVAVLAEGFDDLPENILQRYFTVANDLIAEATQANQASLHELLKQKKPNLDSC